jgi:hypothetical protein
VNEDGSVAQKTTFDSFEEASNSGIAIMFAVILAVRHDDFRNIYYRVRLLNESKTEKQTDAKHPIPNSISSLLPSLGSKV